MVRTYLSYEMDPAMRARVRRDVVYLASYLSFLKWTMFVVSASTAIVTFSLGIYFSNTPQELIDLQR